MMPPLWLVDTSAWIFALRRNPSNAVSQRIAVLLAALAIRHNATLLHADRDFDAIARHSRLVVESLVDGVSSERQ